MNQATEIAVDFDKIISRLLPEASSEVVEIRNLLRSHKEMAALHRGFDPPLIPHQLPTKNPLEFKRIYPFGSDGGRSLTGYAILPRKTEYQQMVKALLAVA